MEFKFLSLEVGEGLDATQISVPPGLGVGGSPTAAAANS